jgi:ribosomal protein L37AE/L43A
MKQVFPEPRQPEFCPACKTSRETVVSAGLVCCKVCKQIIRAEESKDPAQENLL